jgi:hypothetical protein
MAFVPTRTDATKYGSVDGVFPAFGTAIEATKGGFGVKRPDGTFEILDALPLGRASVQLAVEAGSAATAAMVGPAAAGFVAIDFATADYVTAAEVGANAKDGLDSDLITTDLT